jgi:hypothetical protein
MSLEIVCTSSRLFRSRARIARQAAMAFAPRRDSRRLHTTIGTRQWAITPIEEYWRLGYKVLNLTGNHVSTYLDGMKARAGRAHVRLKSIGVPTP